MAAEKPEVRHDKIIVPEHMHPNRIHALATQKAQAQVAAGDFVFDVQMGTGYPVGGEQGTDMEWSYSYQVVPPGGQGVKRPR
jgi:hypothetical protein